MNRNIAIIPARGGSKRLPRKNILSFLGRPIITYTIEAALKSCLYETVVVSTEDSEIVNSIAGLGCEIHHRSPELAMDTVRVVDVINEVLNHYGKQGKEFDYICCLYATSPLRNASDIQKSYQLLINADADYCIACAEYSISPFFAFNVNNSKIERRWPELAKLPHWQKPKVVTDNGSIYWAKTQAFLKSGELEGVNTVGYTMNQARSIDIDTEDDFKLAEYYANNMKTINRK